MALRESRQIFQTQSDITVSGVAERGGILSYVPGVNGLGAYLNAQAVSGLVASPIGVLLDDVEALNHYNHPEYRQRNVVAQGSVVSIATEAEVFTDFVEQTLAGMSVGTYAPGDTLYLADDGKVSRNNGTLNNAATAKRPVIGKAQSALGSDGFLKVRVDL